MLFWLSSKQICVFLFFTQNACPQCNKAYGEKQRVHFDANAQAVSGHTFATKKQAKMEDLRMCT